MTRTMTSSSPFYHNKASHTPLNKNLLSPNFIWLFEDSWEKKLRQAYVQNEVQVYSAFFFPPYFQKAKSANPSSIIGKWYFCHLQHEPIFWVEVHSFGQKFLIYHLTFGPIGDTPSFSEDAISIFISGIFMLFQVDILKIPITGEKHKNLMQEFAQNFTSKEVWVPLPTWHMQAKNVGTFQTLLEISSESWWNSKFGAENRRKLSYLESKKKNQKNKEGRLSKKGLFPFFKKGKKGV